MFCSMKAGMNHIKMGCKPSIRRVLVWCANASTTEASTKPSRSPTFDCPAAFNINQNPLAIDLVSIS